MSKPAPLTINESVRVIMERVLETLPLAKPENCVEIVEEVTGELMALPIVKQTQAKRHKNKVDKEDKCG